MFQFGLFSSHIPCVLLVVFYLLCYASMKLGMNVPFLLNDSEGSVNNIIVHEISIRQEKEYAVAYQVSAEQSVAVTQLEHTNKSFLVVKEKKTFLPFAFLLTDVGYHFPYFSRPPPTIVA